MTTTLTRPLANLVVPESWYNESRGEEWSKVPGVYGLHASISGSIRSGKRVLTARYIPDTGLFVPVRDVWLPAHVLVAVTHLPNRPKYSWFQIVSFLSALVEHRNGDVVDNRATNLEWVDHLSLDEDYDHIMKQPPVPRARPVLRFPDEWTTDNDS